MEMNTNMTTMKANDQEMNWCKETMEMMRKCTDTCRTYSDRTTNMGWKAMFTTMACCCEGCMSAMQKCMEWTAKGRQ